MSRKRNYTTSDGKYVLIEDTDVNIRYGVPYFPDRMLEEKLEDRVKDSNYDVNLEPIFDSVYDERRRKPLNKGVNNSKLSLEEKEYMIIKAASRFKKTSDYLKDITIEEEDDSDLLDEIKDVL